MPVGIVEGANHAFDVNLPDQGRSTFIFRNGFHCFHNLRVNLRNFRKPSWMPQIKGRNNKSNTFPERDVIMQLYEIACEGWPNASYESIKFAETIFHIP